MPENLSSKGKAIRRVGSILLFLVVAFVLQLIDSATRKHIWQGFDHQVVIIPHVLHLGPEHMIATRPGDSVERWLIAEGRYESIAHRLVMRILPIWPGYDGTPTSRAHASRGIMLLAWALFIGISVITAIKASYPRVLYAQVALGFFFAGLHANFMELGVFDSAHKYISFLAHFRWMWSPGDVFIATGITIWSTLAFRIWRERRQGRQSPVAS